MSMTISGATFLESLLLPDDFLSTVYFLGFSLLPPSSKSILSHVLQSSPFLVRKVAKIQQPNQKPTNPSNQVRVKQIRISGIIAFLLI